MDERRIERFLRQKGIADDIQLASAMANARAIAEVAGGRILPKHVDTYVREQEKKGLHAADLAELGRLGAWLIEVDRSLDAPAGPQPVESPTRPQLSQGSWSMLRIARYVIVLAIVSALIVRFKDVRAWLVGRISGSSFAAERARLPNIRPQTVLEDDPKARECLANALLAKVSYVSARSTCYADPEARDLEGTPHGDVMTKRDFEAHLRAESRRRGGSNDGATAHALSIDVTEAAERNSLGERGVETLSIKVRVFDRSGAVITPSGKLSYRLEAKGRDSIAKDRMVAPPDFAGAGNDRWLELSVVVPNVQRGDTRVDVTVSFDERVLTTVRHSF